MDTTALSCVRNHREELKAVLCKAQADLQGRRLLKRLPNQKSLLIFNAIHNSHSTDSDLRLCIRKVRDSIRKVHDFYGWMAKPGLGRGICAGALYRTVVFMAASREERVGTRPRKRPSLQATNIHIEHTVPIAVLQKALKAYKSDFKNDPSQMHRFLINHSVCVAFSMEEERLLREAKVPVSKNDAFTEEGKLRHAFPFRRYLPLAAFAKDKGLDFRIINVVTGREVDLDSFSFSDHERTLARASRMVTESNNLFNMNDGNSQ